MGEVRDASPALLLGRYRSEAIVGEGAFGRVVRAFDMRLKRPVAIKTLKRAMAQTDLGHFRQLEDRFIREAEAGARVGSHANLTEFLDRGREGMASSFLTRLRLGAKLVDAKSVSRLYRSRISGAALLLLVIAAMVAIVAALAVSDAGRTYLHGLEHSWTHFVNWLQDLFS